MPPASNSHLRPGFSDFVQLVGDVPQAPRFVIVSGYDRGWTTNPPLESLPPRTRWWHFCMMASITALLPLDHASMPWKSAKWLADAELTGCDRPGF